MIYADAPRDWKALERRVLRIFQEMGCEVAGSETLSLARGQAQVDVVVRDRTRRPHSLILCECKHWARPVSQREVHAFRTVVQDAGAHLGIIISKAGFQPGAHSAVRNANIQLLSWADFQAEMRERWLAGMVSQLGEWADAIYRLGFLDTEKGHRAMIDSAIDAGGEAGWEEYLVLKELWEPYLFMSPAASYGPTRSFPTAQRLPGVTPLCFVTYQAPRDYFDGMLAKAPTALNAFTEYVSRYFSGREGPQALFDDARLASIRPGETTLSEAETIVGSLGTRIRGAGGSETIFIHASVYHFAKVRAASNPSDAVRATRRRLTLEIDANGIVQGLELNA
jgi:hypothetical protein